MAESVADLQLQLQQLQIERRRVAENIAEQQRQMAMAAGAAQEREHRATGDFAATVAELTTEQVAAAMKQVDSAARDGDVSSALYHSYEKLSTEYEALKTEEHQRSDRIAAYEKALKASQDKVTATTKQFDVVLMHIKQVKQALAVREVRERERYCSAQQPCASWPPDDMAQFNSSYRIDRNCCCCTSCASRAFPSAPLTLSFIHLLSLPPPAFPTLASLPPLADTGPAGDCIPGGPQRHLQGRHCCPQ